MSSASDSSNIMESSSFTVVKNKSKSLDLQVSQFDEQHQCNHVSRETCKDSILAKSFDTDHVLLMLENKLVRVERKSHSVEQLQNAHKSAETSKNSTLKTGCEHLSRTFVNENTTEGNILKSTFLYELWVHRNWSILFTVLGFLVYVCDVFSDLFLACVYMWKGLYIESGLTFIFVLFPSAYITFSSDRRQEELPLRSIKNWVLFFFMIIFSIEPMILYKRKLQLLIRKDEYKSVGYTISLIYNCHFGFKNLSEFRVFEAYTEAVPQMILQMIYIIRVLNNTYYADSDSLYYEPIFSMIFSLAGVVICQCMLENDRLTLTITGYFFTAVSSIFWTVPRIFSVAALSIDFPLYAVSIIGAHWLVVSSLYKNIYIGRQNTMQMIAEKIVNGYLYTFAPPINDGLTMMVLVFTAALNLAEVSGMCLIYALLQSNYTFATWYIAVAMPFLSILSVICLYISIHFKNIIYVIEENPDHLQKVIPCMQIN